MRNMLGDFGLFRRIQFLAGREQNQQRIHIAARLARIANVSVHFGRDLTSENPDWHAIFLLPGTRNFSRSLRTSPANRQSPAASFPDSASSQRPSVRAAKARSRLPRFAAPTLAPTGFAPDSLPPSTPAAGRRNLPGCRRPLQSPVLGPRVDSISAEIGRAH